MFNQKEYMKAYYQRNCEKLKATQKKRYNTLKNDPEFKKKLKARREQLHFGVPLAVIFRKNNGKCYFCGKKAQLGHHLDNDGRTNEKQGLQPGRDIDKIVSVCRACHLNIHRAGMLLARKTRANGYWSRKYDCCIECSTTERRHKNHGLCVNCAARARRNKGAGV